jgi:hypothetical protein
MVKLYSVTTWIIFLAALACSSFLLYVAYSGKNLYKGCEVNGQDCGFHFNTAQKIGYTVVIVIDLLIQCCEYPLLSSFYVNGVSDAIVCRYRVCHW